MHRYVVMVDAGYLLRQAVEIVSQRASTKRADLEINDPSGLIKVLLAKASASLDLAGKELLRVYWYDGVFASGLSSQQRAIVEVDDVQFRAGTVNGKGQQKGVDSLIVTDLIELTTHHAVCDAVLVTGDGDLAVGIEIAQKRGVRIAVLGVEDLAAGVVHHQSWEVTSRADRVGRLGSSDLAPVVKYSPSKAVSAATSAVGVPSPAAVAAAPPAAPPASAPAPPTAQATRPLTQADQTAIKAAVTAFIGQRAGQLNNAVDSATNRIDPGIDRPLIHHVFQALARGQLTNAEKIFARSQFRAALPP
jgi:uncharacterized LabA/DUF88 family protein